jgi:hypothetical protein
MYAGHPVHGPGHRPAHTITADCPVDCLKALLSGRVFNRLARADGRHGEDVAPCGPPATVADVVRLYQHGRLGRIGGLARESIKEIEAGLLAHDLVAAAHRRDVITLECPVECLQPVLSGRVFNRLARADGRHGEDVAPCGPPATVADVVRLCQQGRLEEIAGLGRKSIKEIEVSLIFAGLVIDPINQP